MKKIKTIALSALLLLAAQISWGQFAVIEENNINQQNKATAENLAKKIMEGMKTENYYLLSESEATPAVVKGLNEQTQQAVYDQISEQFGDYQDLRFVEARKQESNQDFTMYRFRGEFTDAAKGPEIRVVLDNDQKLAGFWILPWEAEISNRP